MLQSLYAEFLRTRLLQKMESRRNIDGDIVDVIATVFHVPQKIPQHYMHVNLVLLSE
jgi:hypothetical protein